MDAVAASDGQSRPFVHGRTVVHRRVSNTRAVCVLIASLCRVQRRFGWLLAVSVAVVGLSGLAGCTSGGGENLRSALPTGTQAPVSASPTLTPSRTGPMTTGPNVDPGEIPPAIDPIAKRAHASAGALAFAVFYIRALDWSQATSRPLSA